MLCKLREFCFYVFYKSRTAGRCQKSLFYEFQPFFVGNHIGTHRNFQYLCKAELLYSRNHLAERYILELAGNCRCNNCDEFVFPACSLGFRCGFLGLLHMEIIQERLEREFDLDLVTTSPSVIYKVKLTDGGEMLLDNPSNMPNVAEIEYMEEPVVEAHIMTPSEYVGTIMELCQDKRGVFKDMTYIEEDRVNIKYELPLNEIIYDFFDQLKSRSRGYASFDYELKEYAKSDLVKLDFLLNGDMCDALSTIVHKDKAYAKGRAVAEKLQEVIPRQQFEIPIQAAIGGKIIARETVRAVRKDVLAKCYGGDITRKKKLLEKQKEGKKRMRQIGTVSLPSEAFMSVLKIN